MIQKIVFDSPAYRQARDIRYAVFVVEQSVSAAQEYDEFEAVATHFVAIDESTSEICGTARWRFTEKGIKLERFAVLPAHRNKGIGQSLVRAVLADIEVRTDTAGKLRYLHAQESAVGLYKKLGFQIEGEPFYEANIKHMKMTLAV